MVVSSAASQLPTAHGGERSSQLEQQQTAPPGARGERRRGGRGGVGLGAAAVNWNFGTSPVLCLH